VNPRADSTLKLLRTSTRGPAGQGAIHVNAAAGAAVTPEWFDPGHWRARGALLGQRAGRGAALLFEHQGRRYVLRHYRRGGLPALLNHDSYLWLGEARTRPFAEQRQLLLLEAAGLPVPRVVAARYVRQGLAYRADLITEYLPDTDTLAERLAAGDVGLATWAAIGRCIRNFHEHGLCHADLNAHNILLRGEEQVFLLDFDRARRRRPGLWRDANLARLRRSLDALEDGRAQRRFDDTQWQCLLAAWFQRE
jgi:3-deoxy-D-manno-octulosonic acid kinase